MKVTVMKKDQYFLTLVVEKCVKEDEFEEITSEVIDTFHTERAAVKAFETILDEAGIFEEEEEG